MPASLPNPFISINDGDQDDLLGTASFSQAGHRWSANEAEALTFAFAARRPLLVRGEAGCGKSQIARAAAKRLDAELVVEVIHPRFEARDLLYRYDVVARLSDAQIAGKLDPSNRRYVKEGAMWKAMRAIGPGRTPPVLLIDEIDKADAEVPNALLEILGNRSFRVPELDDDTATDAARREYTVSADGLMPLVVITTNEERELPAAFVRRCAVLNLNPPAEDTRFTEWLVERGRVHGHLDIDERARTLAAQQVLADRKVAIAAGHARVGLAEYIDLLHAVHELAPGPERASEQVEWIMKLGAYALVKGAEQDQRRAAVDPEKERS